jgi:uncharacterized protein (TIGR02145 family)
MKSRRWMAIISAVLAMLLVGSLSTTAGDCGDLNNDGVGSDIGDLAYLVDFLFFGGPAPQCQDCPSTVTDYDGNVYQTVQINGRCWMMENLEVTHYRNGDSIPVVADRNTWAGLTSGACCSYDNDEGNVATYGRLYNGYAVLDSRNIAPAGWHVPTDAEWQILVLSLGGDAVAGGAMKEAGTAHWVTPNTGATNESGFTALPGGYREDNAIYFPGLGYEAYFWSTTEHQNPYGTYVWNQSLSNYGASAYRSSAPKGLGFSVRCVRDN